jgi:hypothetical protein
MEKVVVENSLGDEAKAVTKQGQEMEPVTM